MAELTPEQQEQARLVKKGNRIEIVIIILSMLTVGYLMGKHGHYNLKNAYKF